MIASTALKLLRLKPEYFFLGHPVYNYKFCHLRYLQEFVNLAKLMIILLKTNANSGKLGLQKRHKVSNVIIN